MIANLKPGKHDMMVWMSGYRASELRRVSIFSGVTNSETFVLYDSDEDYDRVGDRTEIIGYTNIFKYARDDDPDGDGLNNLFEFEHVPAV